MGRLSAVAARGPVEHLPPMFRRLEAAAFDDHTTPLTRLTAVNSNPDAERSRALMGAIRRELYETLAPGPWIAGAVSNGTNAFQVV